MRSGGYKVIPYGVFPRDIFPATGNLIPLNLPDINRSLAGNITLPESVICSLETSEVVKKLTLNNLITLA